MDLEFIKYDLELIIHRFDENTDVKDIAVLSQALPEFIALSIYIVNNLTPFDFLKSSTNQW